MRVADEMAAIGAEQIVITAKLAASAALHEMAVERAIAAMQANGAARGEVFRALFDHAIMQAELLMMVPRDVTTP